MTSNLIKSPLLAVFFGALLVVAGGYIPYSEEHAALLAENAPTLLNTLLLAAFALYLTLLMAVGFGSVPKKSVRSVAFLTIPLLGCAWLAPNLESILYSGNPGVLSRQDALLSMGFYLICTLLALGLFLLVFQARKPEDPREAAAKPIVTYKLKILPFVIKLVVLPLVYLLLFLAAWNFIHWSSADVRAFYGGEDEARTFMTIVLTDWMVILALAKGLLTTLLALPLLFLFPGKRVLYIVMTTLLNLCGVVWLLNPTPLMPDAVRLSTILYSGVLTVVFSALAALLLHTSFRKEVQEPPKTRPQPTPQQIAMAKARAAKAAAAAAGDGEKAGGPTPSAAKTGADAISATMKGEA